ncbi:unnamed protein product [Nippostrongylus brasiliensis]|uniref:Uncharacterized protein n=1 Tax=Nippostrongylus brasiliensis TaxID=27835 RepID=A0A0N4YD19_NIPBR|nr:unnamed protein product [Nippostrongylus brasiliensis]
MGKRWNLDGLDGYKHYWRDLRKEKRVFSRRNIGGGSVTVWAVFSGYGPVALEFVSCNMDSEDYQSRQCSHTRVEVNYELVRFQQNPTFSAVQLLYRSEPDGKFILISIASTVYVAADVDYEGDSVYCSTATDTTAERVTAQGIGMCVVELIALAGMFALNIFNTMAIKK